MSLVKTRKARIKNMSNKFGKSSEQLLEKSDSKMIPPDYSVSY